MAKTKAQIIAEAQVVKNATEVGENTATRVGGVLEDLADADGLVIIPVTGTSSGGNITLSSNPFTQVQTAVNAGQHVVVRVTIASDIIDFTMNTYSASVATYIGTANFLENEFQLLCSASSAVITNRSTSNTFSTGESVPNVGIDATPTQGSDNLVKSGGVAKTNVEIIEQITAIGGANYNFTRGISINNTGTESSNSQWGASPFFAAKNGNVVKTKTGGHGTSSLRTLILYDNNKNYLASYYTSQTTEQTYTLSTTGTAYIRICFWLGNNTGASNFSDIYLKINGTRVFSPKINIISEWSPLTFTNIHALETRAASLKTDGNLNSATARRVTAYDIHEYLDEHLFCSPYAPNDTATCGVAYYNNSWEYIGRELAGVSHGEQIAERYELTIPPNAYYVRIMTAGSLTHDYLVAGGGNALLAKFTEPQPFFTITGKNNVLSSSNLLYGYRGGRKYRLSVGDRAIDMSGVTVSSAYSMLYITYYSDTKSVIQSSSLATVGSWQRFYDIECPSGTTSIRIGIRVTSGIKQSFFIEDITDSDGVINKSASVSQFNRIAVIGDSWSSGYYYTNNGSTLHADIRKYSWIANLARKNGVYWYNFAVGGATVASWEGQANGFRNDSAKGLNALMSAPPCDLYIIWWGFNERTRENYPIGSMADVNDADYTQNADTFYGNTARCVQAVMAHAPLARIVFITSQTPSSYTGTTVANGDLIKPRLDIIEHFGIASLDMNDDNWYYKNIEHNRSNLWGSHPQFMDMSGMACAFERLFSECCEKYRAYMNELYNENNFNVGTDTNPNTNEG